MPEGHIVHRLAYQYRQQLGEGQLRVSSPQGRFADSAKRLDSKALTSTDAHGKHLFLGFDDEGFVRVHLGLYGKVTFGTTPSPQPVGAVRLRLESERAYADLRGPTACELITAAEKDAIHARLGPDPLRADADTEYAWNRISKSRRAISDLLLDQKIVSGIGNVYRAEVLFRHGIDPHLEGRKLSRTVWDIIWADLVTLMRDGVRLGRIDTVYPEHTPSAMGREPRVDDHGGEVYVYRRGGEDCHVCAATVTTLKVNGRNLFWCPTCQKR